MKSLPNLPTPVEFKPSLNPAHAHRLTLSEYGGLPTECHNMNPFDDREKENKSTYLPTEEDEMSITSLVSSLSGESVDQRPVFRTPTEFHPQLVDHLENIHEGGEASFVPPYEIRIQTSPTQCAVPLWLNDNLSKYAPARPEPVWTGAPSPSLPRPVAPTNRTGVTTIPVGTDENDGYRRQSFFPASVGAPEAMKYTSNQQANAASSSPMGVQYGKHETSPTATAATCTIFSASPSSGHPLFPMQFPQALQKESEDALGFVGKQNPESSLLSNCRRRRMNRGSASNISVGSLVGQSTALTTISSTSSKSLSKFSECDVFKQQRKANHFLDRFVSGERHASQMKPRDLSIGRWIRTGKRREEHCMVRSNNGHLV